MQKTKFIIFISALVLFIHPLKAQRFKVGLLGGVNISDVDGMDPVDPDNDFHKFGFTGGLLVNTRLGDKNLIEMEIAYTQKGSSMPPDTTQANFNNNDYYTFRLNYVDIDLVYRHMIHLNLNKKPTNKFGLEAGASAGYLFKYYYSVRSVDYTSYITLNKTDVSLFAGFSYNFTPGFCIDLRYYNSILPVIPSNAGNSQYQLLYNNSWNLSHNLVFQITFKYTFGAGVAPSSNDNPAPVAPNPGG